MFYVQTTIEIKEEDMKVMTENVLEYLIDVLVNNGLPITKELKAAVVKETLKTLIEKELDN